MRKTVRSISVISCMVLFCLTNGYADDSEEILKTPASEEVLTDFEEVVTADKQQMYLLKDTAILQESKVTSTSVEEQPAGSSLYIVGVENGFAKVLTGTGKVGYVQMEKLTDKLEYVFADTDETKYAEEGTELLSVPYEDGTVVMTLELNDEVHLTGTTEYDAYQRVEVDGRSLYVNSESLMDEEKVVYVAPAPVQAAASSYSYDYSANYSGAVLNPVNGTIIGPSGKETYYNLNMSGVISIMQSLGYNYTYWVRSDGVKMYGDYIMVAADLSIHPRGSLVTTSLGTGLVCDTGTFIYSNPYQIDIATTW